MNYAAIGKRLAVYFSIVITSFLSFSPIFAHNNHQPASQKYDFILDSSNRVLICENQKTPPYCDVPFNKVIGDNPHRFEVNGNSGIVEHFITVDANTPNTGKFDDTTSISIGHPEIFRSYYQPKPPNPTAPSTISVTITVNDKTPQMGQILDPIPVTLQKGAEAPIEKPAESNQPGGQNSSVVTYDAKFENVPPGDYQVCVPLIKKCLTVKANGGNIPVNFVTDNSIAGQVEAPSTAKKNTSVSDTCDVGAFSWVFCPIIRLAQDATDVLKELVLNILKTSPLSAGVKGVMKNLTTLANVGFVLIFLVIIASTTLSIGLSNYSIKKMLPRFVLAVIAVQFAFPIIQLILDITNIIGDGIGTLISVTAAGSPDPNAWKSAWVGSAELATIAAAGFALAPALIVPVLFAVLGLLIGLLTVYATLFARAIMIQLLAILAPLAIAAWVLPNTEQFAKKWWGSFFKLLLMYPIITILFAVGSVISRLPNVVGGSSASTAGKLFASLAPIIVFFMVPSTFKWAGSAMGAVSKRVNGYGGKVKGKVSGSQLKKDLQQSRRENAAMKYISGKGFKPVNRAVAGAGFFGTSASNRKMAGLAASALKQRVSDAGGLVEGASNDHLLDLASGRNAGGIKADEYTQRAAIARLASNGDVDRLRKVKDSMEAAGGGAMTAAGERAWKNGTSDKFKDLSAAAPDLMSPKGKSAFDGMTAKQLAGLRGESAQKYMEHLRDKSRIASTAPVGSTAHTEAVRSLGTGMAAIKRLAATPGLKSEVSGETGATILKHVDSIFTGTSRAEVRALIDPTTGAFH